MGNPQELQSTKNVASVPNLQNQVRENVDVIDDAEAEEEESLNDLLKTVLITLRDHPDIIMNILEGKCSACETYLPFCRHKHSINLRFFFYFRRRKKEK